jgi:hypothetical protein
MRLLRFAAFSLSLACTGSTVAYGQTTDSTAQVGDFGSDSNLCIQHQSRNGNSAANCSHSISEPNGYSGTASASAFGSYSVMRISAFAGVQRDDKYQFSVQMQATAHEDLQDFLSLGNLPPKSSFFIATSLLAIPGGSAQATVLLQVDVRSSNQGSECTSVLLGKSSCSTHFPLPDGTGVPVDLAIHFIGSAAVSCGPPSCGGSDASVGPGEVKVLAVRVVDSNLKPVNTATITSTSGHKYPTHFASATSLTATPNPSTGGQPVTFTATIASFGRSGTPTGKVTFKDFTTGTTLGHVTLNAGIASLTTSSLTSGTHAITATYGGDDWSASSKSTVSQVVN